MLPITGPGRNFWVASAHLQSGCATLRSAEGPSCWTADSTVGGNTQSSLDSCVDEACSSNPAPGVAHLVQRSHGDTVYRQCAEQPNNGAHACSPFRAYRRDAELPQRKVSEWDPSVTTDDKVCRRPGSRLQNAIAASREAVGKNKRKKRRITGGPQPCHLVAKRALRVILGGLHSLPPLRRRYRGRQKPRVDASFTPSKSEARTAQSVTQSVRHDDSRAPLPVTSRTPNKKSPRAYEVADPRAAEPLNSPERRHRERDEPDNKALRLLHATMVVRSLGNRWALRGERRGRGFAEKETARGRIEQVGGEKANRRHRGRVEEERQEPERERGG
ncbi:Hypothetical protein SMAX5B_008399 [Scophthalmus maximus]|uniref:Uncharacterized protein n=1 Tax=Scophthalmus maximus TaxID=52904 RepID=A0A2U9B3H3_SCOMX|nr:Hypothetical protein SMAX5B_008399 [Scophthalmus maximus]